MTVILVTGGTGQLGRALRRRDWGEDVAVVAPSRDELDLFDAVAVARFIRAETVGVVINAAAYTAVDKAETEPQAAFDGNVRLPATLAEASLAAGVALVHVSTDYVFDGRSPAPYEVDDPAAPINVYGASKAAGELAASRIQPRSAIVRTSWLVSPDGSNFVKTMLRLGQTRDRIGVVADQRGRPTLAGDLADALAVVALRMAEDEAAPTGAFHFANAGATDWHGFALAIFEAAARRGLTVPEVDAITSADYPTPARRPQNSELSTRRIERDYTITPRDWREGLPALIDDILEAA